MCLAIPGLIERTDAENISPRMADINFGGIKKRICIDFLPEIKKGDYVVVHAGFALERINKAEAENQLKAFKEAEEIIRSRIR